MTTRQEPAIDILYVCSVLSIISFYTAGGLQLEGWRAPASADRHDAYLQVYQQEGGQGQDYQAALHTWQVISICKTDF